MAFNYIDDVKSPCVSICTLDATGDYCTGCYRTLDEIGHWARLTADQKRAVIACLPARQALVGEPADGTE